MCVVVLVVVTSMCCWCRRGVGLILFSLFLVCKGAYAAVRRASRRFLRRSYARRKSCRLVRLLWCCCWWWDCWRWGCRWSIPSVSDTPTPGMPAKCTPRTYNFLFSNARLLFIILVTKSLSYWAFSFKLYDDEVNGYFLFWSVSVTNLSVWKPEQLINTKITRNIKHTHFSYDNLYMSRWANIGSSASCPQSARATRREISLTGSRSSGRWVSVLTGYSVGGGLQLS